jgi:S1-C subfamily serine protease
MEVQTQQAVAAALQSLKPGDTIAIDVERAGARQSLRATLGTRPETTLGTP